MFFYLAAPIDHVESPSTGRSLAAEREMAKDVLVGRGVSAFDPFGAWSASGPPNGTIQEMNREAIRQSDGLLALLPLHTRTFGVPMEIEYAIQQGVPVAVSMCGDDVRPSWSLQHHAVNVWRLTADAVQDLCDRTQPVGDAGTVAGSGRVDPPPLTVARDHPDAMLPTKAYDDDAGWDLFVDKDVQIWPGSVTDVPTGVRVAIREGMYGRIVGRSSTHRKLGLSVVEGIIDAGYRGPLFAALWNPTDAPISLGRGSRVSQLILAEVPLDPLHVVGRPDDLPPSERGDNGFGSSGR